nr:Gag-Pol polyprotein [Tanacetum cinerariifolium]
GPREKVGSPVVQKSGIQCFNCKEYGHFSKECRKPKRVKDSAYHKEKMLLCKQAEQGVPLQAEQYDWLAHTDEEVDEQELEAHYSYMAKIQEVPNADSGNDSEPVEQVLNKAKNNVFANALQHFKQSESVSNTCLVEMDDSNVTPDSPDMCEDDIQNDQNDVESDDEQTSQSLGESISVRDSCLVALQTKQTEFEKYKAFNDCTVDYDKLKRKLNDALGQIAHKDTVINEGLKTKAYELSVVKEKHDELMKQSILTKSHYEGIVKQKMKVHEILGLPIGGISLYDLPERREDDEFVQLWLSQFAQKKKKRAKHNTDFHQIVDFLEASHIRIKTTDQETKIIATVDGKPQTISESSLRRHLKLNDEEGISSLADAELFENLSLMGYNILPSQRTVPLFALMIEHQSPQSAYSPPHDSLPLSHQTIIPEPIPHDLQAPTKTLTHRRLTKRAIRIAQSKALSPAADEPASLLRDDRHGEAFPTVFSSNTGQDMENIAMTSAMSHESSPRVPSLDADEGSMQQRLHEWMELYTSLQRQQSQMADKIKEQDIKLSGLKARVKGIIDIGEELGANKSTEKWSNDTEETVNVLSLMEAVNILSNGGATFPTAGVPTVSGSVPTVSAIFTTNSVVTPYTRRSRGITIGSSQHMRIPIISAKYKGKEKVTETKVPKKKKLQEQIDAQLARDMKEEFARENQRLSKQAARDFEIARIHAKEELKLMIEGLDRSNEVIAKHLSEYEQVEANLSVREKIELISELVKYQDHLAEILKYQAQQSKPSSKKEQRKFYIIKQCTRDKEKELWVELKRLFEPNSEDQLWTYHQAFMHDPLDWKLYDTCGVHHVSTKKNQEIFMKLDWRCSIKFRGGLLGIKCSKAFLLLVMYLQNEHYALWEFIEFGDSYKAPPEETGKGPPNEKVQKKSESNSKNMAFISSSNTSSGKGEVHTASVSTASTQVSTASIDVAAASLSHDTIFIEFGDSYKAPPEETGKGPPNESSARKKERTVAITIEDMHKRRNDVKARTTLLLALPAEHQLRFSKDDLETMSLNDVYNHLKVYEPEVQKKSESNSKNMPFISSSNTSSEKGEVHTASVLTASTQVSTASIDVAAASLNHDTICTYVATQSNGS